ncbi:ABC transporter B family member 2 [Phytophthora rubi]|uniref:ABC transporter B family member 2 n=1 Tax=Phytophthora rubi TaxID=129364 RepID=A0A6A3KDN5_9STRA|nr:ABC transporter B family member 2 [Phytophthora rubi]KAE9005590.1 ABC transporter B family member 2 [Phytophthora rubi]KAE9318044.1 ABC transporter B family member 2 [Phytophthora rubi]
MSPLQLHPEVVEPGGDETEPTPQHDYVQVVTPRANANAEASKVSRKPDASNIMAIEAEDATTDKRKTKKKPPPTIPFRQLYRYGSTTDNLLLSFGVLMAGVNGALFPCMALVFGDAIGAFAQADGGVDMNAVNQASLDYIYIAIALFITDYVAYVVFVNSSERQMKALRDAAFKHMLHMNIAWYDSSDPLTLSSRLTGDTVKIKDGMGQKLGDSVKYTCQFITGYVIGFVRGWDMSLVMACVMPFMVASLGVLMTSLRKRAVHSQQMYAEAGAVAEETLGSIRTVSSLNAEKLAINKYNDRAAKAEETNIQMAKFSACVFGLFMCSIWLMYAAGLWYGGWKVAHGKATPSEVFQSFFGVLMGTISLGQITPNISAVAEAKGAAAQIYKILDTPSAIDASRDDEGDKPESCVGRIQALSVNFTYPSRPDVQILNDYNVTIEPGQTVAFVGASGGGKSTLISLLERFYDPNEGTILLDGRDVKTLNIKWLRSQIGLVSQEPVLFATTILENIAAGGNGITRDQVVEAAKLANAHNFIMTLPQQYDTLVGEKGVSLSGGQKQRVAIARAVVREPKILVLDEATSALDAESERVVQAALNDLMDKTQMTTLVIAHRLSTIRRADKIVVVNSGHVVEEGTHDELVAIEDGIYRKLYTIQEEKAQEEAQAAASALALAEDGEPHPVTLQKRSSRSVISEHLDEEKVLDQVNAGGSSKTFTIFDAMAFSRPERPAFVVGIIAAAVMGCALPSSAILISELVATMTTNYTLYKVSHIESALDDLKHDVMVYGLCYVGGSLVMFLAAALQNYCFKCMSEKLTSRLRDIHFTALCRQNIGFFDEKKNATGALTADLSTNATKVALISGDSQGRVVQAIFTFVAALVISFTTGSWLLTLVMLAVFPFLIAGQMIRMRQMKSSGQLSDELSEVGAHASEALSNIRTVVSLGLEKSICTKFSNLLEEPLASGRREAQLNGVALGFSSFILFATYSLVFWYGGKLVQDDKINFKELMRTLMAIMMSAQGIGNATSFMGESDNALKAGKAIVDLRDRNPPIDSFQEGGRRLEQLQGKIEFKNILFRYPTRPEVTVLRNYNLTIEAGQTVAFCGPSGGGKSTGVSLIERFYDPIEGQVLLDGIDTKDLNLNWLRSQIGLVGQEPTLFIGTIAENIAYGLTEKPTQQDIEEAARMANAHGFITKFPDGYDTQVGMKGEQLSGGQKQRIAIARAILKNPNIFLLDEATSALDSESEKVVQEALDKVVALKRRTTIIIAHRLSTIRKADKICVVSGGKIAEQGTHHELIKLKGIYAKLVEHAAN